MITNENNTNKFNGFGIGNRHFSITHDETTLSLDVSVSHGCRSECHYSLVAGVSIRFVHRNYYYTADII